MAKKIVLISMDGYGISLTDEGNAIRAAKKPNLDDLIAHYPYGALDASGLAVGLPWGEVGNSEVGHLNLGAGSVLYQNLPRINLAIEGGSFFDNEILLQACEHAKKNRSNLHIYGITSPGGVHGHIDHIKALIELARKNKVKNVFLHCITDGRDAAPRSAEEYIKDLQGAIKKFKTGTIASLCGRFWAMDRNNGWDRTQRAYELLTQGKGTPFRDPMEAINASYKNEIDDESLEPSVITDRKGNPLTTIKENDALIFANYRPDRARQIARAFSWKQFDGWQRGTAIKNLNFVTMMEYEAGMPVKVAYPPEYIKNPFGKLVASAGLKQLRIAETEKYAHVTYFFNGGNEEQYKGEDRILVPSPKVKSYDEKPEMSAVEVTKKLVTAINSKKYDFCLVNFANPDMVGHTGNLKATIKGVETVDECVGKIVEANKKVGGVTIITADHGNAEIVIDPITKGIDKEHSTTPVPFIVVDEELRKDRSPEEIELAQMQINPIGILADVAPTMCEIMGIKPHSDMTGRSLLQDLM